MTGVGVERPSGLKIGVRELAGAVIDIALAFVTKLKIERFRRL
jgi:hypothetical protein